MFNISFLVFCSIGALNTLVNISFFLLILNLTDNVALSSGCGFSVGAITGYILNSRITFNFQLSLSKLFKYLSIQIVLLSLTISIVDFLENKFGWVLCAQLTALVVTTILNFTLLKAIVYKEEVL